MKVCYPSIIDPRKPERGILDLKKAGVENIVHYIGVRFPSRDDRPEDEKDIRQYRPETIVSRYIGMAEACRENGMGIALACAPYGFRHPDGGPDISGLIERSAQESIKLCREAGCRHLVVRAPHSGETDAVEREANRAFYVRLAGLAGEYGVGLLVSNQVKWMGGRMVRGSMSQPSEAVEYIDSLNREIGADVFGFCLDTGVCTICGNDMNAFVTALGDRLKAVILSDSDGRIGANMLPFTYVPYGVVQTDWKGLIMGLRAIDYDGDLVIRSTGTRTAFPLRLKPEIDRLSRLVGDYFRWQIQMERNLKKYEKRVLFGAGNMCRNYMRNYGETHPPLFTCDNNRKLWGTTFEGLEVRSPEALRGLPADCAVFICNIYYREVEAQLRGMGLDNPVEYFNDEYVPVFYSDGLGDK